MKGHYHCVCVCARVSKCKDRKIPYNKRVLNSFLFFLFFLSHTFSVTFFSLINYWALTEIKRRVKRHDKEVTSVLVNVGET